MKPKNVQKLRRNCTLIFIFEFEKLLEYFTENRFSLSLTVATICLIEKICVFFWTTRYKRLCNRRTHTHPFNGPFSGTTQVSRYQKGKTNLDFTAARDSEWQWHQLGHMQVCTSLQTDNHASTPPLGFFTGRMPFLPPNQQRQSTDGKTVVARVDEQWLAVGRCIKLHTRRVATDDATAAAPLPARTCPRSLARCRVRCPWLPTVFSRHLHSGGRAE